MTAGLAACVGRVCGLGTATPPEGSGRATIAFLASNFPPFLPLGVAEISTSWLVASRDDYNKGHCVVYAYS